MYSQRLSALLVDVDAAIREEDGPSVVFPSAANGEHTTQHDVGSEEQGGAQVGMDEADDDDYKDAEAEGVDEQPDTVADANVQADSGVLIVVPQPLVVIDAVPSQTHDLNRVDSPVRSPYRCGVPPGISEAAWNRAPDAPSMDLFPPGSEEYAFLNNGPDSPSHKSAAHAAADDTATSCVAKPAAASMCFYLFILVGSPKLYKIMHLTMF